MEFKVQRTHPIPKGYDDSEFDAARAFSKSMINACGRLVKSVSLQERQSGNELPIQVIIDDRSESLTKKKIDDYITKMGSIVHSSRKPIHVKTVKLSEHWKYTRNKDLNYLTGLQQSLTLYDSGFVLPVKHLLSHGKIRPSKESSLLYHGRSQITLKRARNHLLQAMVDLYWAAIDAAHAAIMRTGTLPPKPVDVPMTLSHLYPRLERSHLKTYTNIYNLSKSILHKEVFEVTGDEYFAKRQAVEKFIDRMKLLAR